MFKIEKFKIIQSDGAFQNQSITIVYKTPPIYADDEIDDRWYEYIKELKATL